MKKILLEILGSIIATFCIVSCCKENREKPLELVYNEPDPPVWTLNSDEKELGTPDFLTFDIDRDYSKLSERLHTDPKKGYYVENTVFNEVINIHFSGDNVVIDSDEDDEAFKIKTSGAHVTIKALKKIECVLYGKTSNGSIKIVGDKKVRLTLNGLDLKNPKGPAISCLSKSDCYIVTDSASTLRDDSVYATPDSTEQQKGCIFAEGKLAFSGTAKLRIFAHGADAIHSDKSVFIRRCSDIYIESHGGDAIQAQKHIHIEGGIVNINSTHAGSHGLVADSIISIAGGRTTILSNTTGHNDKRKNSRGIFCDSLISITGGIVKVKESSLGGKGIRSGRDIYIKNAIVDVLTFGYDDKQTSSKNKGIRANNDVHIDSSRIRVRATNGWNEGLEAKHHLYLTGSLVELKAHDDALNVGIDADAKRESDNRLSGDIIMNGGRLYTVSEMDATDSNGEIHINDGLVFSISHGRGSRAFDCDFRNFYIGPNAIVVGISNAISPFTGKLLEHPSCELRRPMSDAPLRVTPSGSNENIISFDKPIMRFKDEGYRVQISVPEFATYNTVDFCRGGNINPKHTFHGLAIGGTVSQKSNINRHSLTKSYTVIEELQP